MKIRHQLLGGFLAVVLLFAMAGAVTIVELRSIETANATVERDTVSIWDAPLRVRRPPDRVRS